MSGGGDKKNPSKDASRTAKGTGGLTFEPPSAAPADGPDIGFAPDLPPVAASSSREPDAIDDDAPASPRRSQPKSVDRGRWPSAQHQDLTPSHLEEDAEGRLNPVARMLSKLPPRPDHQRSLLDEVQDALREQLGAKPPQALHEQQRTFHLPSQMPSAIEESTRSPDQNPSRNAYREDDVLDAEVNDGSSYAGTGEDEAFPVVEPWTPVSDRAGSVEIAPPSDPDGTPISATTVEADEQAAPLAPKGSRSPSETAPSKGANAFRDATQPLTPLPKPDHQRGIRPGQTSAKDTLLSFPAVGEPDVRLSPAPSSSASSPTTSQGLAPQKGAPTYPIARQAIANLLAGKAPPDRRRHAEPASKENAPLAVDHPESRPSKTPWRARDVVATDVALDEVPSQPAPPPLAAAPAAAEASSSVDNESPRSLDGVLFEDQTDRNAFELPPQTPAPISLIDGLPVEDEPAAPLSTAATSDQSEDSNPAPMTATETGKMPMPNAPRAISMPDMAALEFSNDAKRRDDDATEDGTSAAAKQDEEDAPKTLVNFSIGPAVMRKPADVATPKRRHAFSADENDPTAGASSQGSQQRSQQRLETLVDTMLVGQDADTDDGEVHLQFKDDVLRGLYVSLVREGEGLVAKFVVADATVRRQIDGEAQRLVDRLAARGMNIRGYSIEVRDGGDAPDRISAYGDDGYEGF